MVPMLNLMSQLSNTIRINEAITNSHSTMEGSTLRYDCFGKTAQGYFDYLGNSTERQERDRYGLWTVRSFPGGWCAQHNQNADETTAKDFDCEISMVAP
jgi:hypothetical protein